jgi:hemoglobin-like flavoprotein
MLATLKPQRTFAMILSPVEVRLVRYSFARVEPIAEQAAALFYTHLFRADPALRPLFRGDMQAQGRRLIQMIGAAVALLEQPEALLPVLRQLGARHAGYGVRESHYATVGGALIQTLAEGLGDAFTAQTRVAWLKAFGLISKTMMAAAKASEPGLAAA